jgi:excisionase family DNA binding protein
MHDTILISRRETSRLLSISLRTVDNLIASKQLVVRRIGSRALISRKSVEEFARRDHITPRVTRTPTSQAASTEGQ